MGCDVHMCVEINVGGETWQIVRLCPNDQNPYHGWRSRDYRVFAILSGVRDAWDIPLPLSAHRGWPDNPSPEVEQARRDDWTEGDIVPDLGDHSLTYATAAEVMAYDWSAMFPSFDNEPPIPYRTVAASFLAWFEDKVKPLIDLHGKDNVRLVWGFDS